MEPLSGKLELGLNVSIGYYAQHVAESLNSQSTVIDEMLKKAHDSITQARRPQYGGLSSFFWRRYKKESFGSFWRRKIPSRPRSDSYYKKRRA